VIRLITGLPGNGKTLRTVWELSKIAQAGQRAIFVNGIKDLAITHHELADPEKWFEVGANSLVVIDECQRVFRPRGNGTKVPEHVEKLETHRHLGIDLWLITQHPNLLDMNVRKLVGEHIHVFRPWGLARATVLKWQEVSNPQSQKDIRMAQKESWSFPKDAYKLYKSAEAHTHKRQLPMKMLALAGVAMVATVASIGYAWHWVNKQMNPQATQAQATKSPVETFAPVGNKTPKLQLAEWLEERKPRIPGLAETAPVYDDVMKPQSAPLPQACVEMAAKCHCYTYQATVLDMPQDLCKQIVRRGYFDATRKREEAQGRPDAVLDRSSHVQPAQAVQAAVNGQSPYNPVSLSANVNPVALSDPGGGHDVGQQRQALVPQNSPWRAK
jgi:zona occludens toxin